MSKIGTIINREYMSRVKKKTFLVTTILLPLLFVGGSALIGYISATSTKKLKVAVVDESKVFDGKLWDSSDTKSFTYFALSELDSLRQKYDTKGFDAMLHIAPLQNNLLDTSSIKLYTEGALGMESSSYIDKRINKIYQAKVLSDKGMSGAQIDSISSLHLSYKSVTKDKNALNSSLASGIAGACGFLLYLTLFIYGMMVMRGVMEEKTNRIAEVIISSVKPFELMMGKIIGIGLVGLTQFAIWILLMGVLTTVLGSTMGGSSAGIADQIAQAPGAASAVADSGIMSKLVSSLSGINWLLVAGSFVFYFLGGYMLYASLFAAVGSLVDEDASDAQGFTMPITLPIIAAFIISMQVVNDPSSSMAVGASLFPLTSPIVMMARIPFNPPGLEWQLPLSMALLVLAFLGSVWVSGKIYRQGILMYGKKLKWKDVIGFFRMK
jgi:ABC-2 type transport system permease protein